MFGDIRRYEKEINLLVNALTRMSKAFDSEAAITEALVNVPEIPALAMSPRDAFYADTEVVPLAEADNCICAEFIMVYPPEFQFLFPGK